MKFRASLPNLRRELPVWCEGCQRYLRHNEEHDEDCREQIEQLAQRAAKRAAGATPLPVLLLLYGLFACLGVAAYLVWGML